MRSKLNRKLLENLESEINILKTLNHPHIVLLLDCQKTPTYIHLVMEYSSLGDLSVFIKKRDRLHTIPATAAMSQKYPSIGSGLNEVIVRHFLQQLAGALEFLRLKSYVHRDVKPQNLLLDPPVVTYDEKGIYGEAIVDTKRQIPEFGLPDLPVLKLADFGFARSLPSTAMAETLCGSPLYMAPEILRYEKYDTKADLWSVGTVLYEMVVGKPPFRANNHVELLRKIERGEDKIKFPEDITASDDMRQLIRSLLKKSPVERLNYVDLFKHPVVKDEIPGAVLPSRNILSRSTRHVREGPTSEQERLPESPGRDRMNEYLSTPQVPTSPVQTTDPLAARRPTPPLFAEAEQDHPGKGSPNPRAAIARTSTGLPVGKPMYREPSRPTLPHTSTAPPRQIDRERDTRPQGVPMERQESQKTASPGSSFLVQKQMQQQQLQQQIQQQTQQRPISRDFKETREKAEQDAMFASDYVVIEKRTVEVNALADEIAASPQLTGKPPSTPPSSAGAITRRITSANTTPSRTVAVKRPESYHQPRSSYERKLGSSPSATSSALAKALAMVNTRLHGIGFLSPSAFANYVQSGPQTYATNTYHQPGSMVMIEAQASTSNVMADEDSAAVQAIEEAANRSDVVFQFAEVKFQQLVPVSGMDSQRLGDSTHRGQEPKADDDIDLPVEAIVTLSEEALVLYVKALSLLAHAMDMASGWWSTRSNDHAGQLSNTEIAASARMNNAVQWVRERFNTVLEKAEYVRQKLHEAQMHLPTTHPSHPSNRPSSSALSTGLGTSADKVVVSPGITAEKLMYDRALEMSKTAAVNELVGEDLAQCEIAYVTSIWMLEGVLETDETSNEDGVGLVIEEEDRKVVEKCLFCLCSQSDPFVVLILLYHGLFVWDLAN